MASVISGSLRLLVGLGNPGKQYLFTRHNIGFIALDFLAAEISRPDLLKPWLEKNKITDLQISNWKSEHKAEVAKISFTHSSEKYQALLAKPQTFMNRSGESVQPLSHFYKIPLDHILVIHDDIDLLPQQMKFQKNRGHGGQNGVRDISEQMGSMDYARLKLGVGRPIHPEMSPADHVLSNFPQDEMSQLKQFLLKANEGMISWITRGFEKTMNEFNKK